MMARARAVVAADLARGQGERELLAAQRQTELDAWAEHEQALTLGEKVQRMTVEGWRVESQVDGRVVMVAGRRPNHVLHLLLSIVTVGLWVIPWIVVSVTGGERRRVLTVGQDGRVVVTDA